MALSAISKAQKFIKPINHYRLGHFVFPMYKPVSTKKVSLVFVLHRCMCTKAVRSSVGSLNSDQGNIADWLVSVFTKTPGLSDNQELKNFGPKLTTQIVETVLKKFKSWKLALDFFYWASNQDGYKHNCYTYTTVASILSNTKQKEPLAVLASDIVRLRCSMTPGALGFFLRCLGNLGMVDEAIFLFDQVKETGLCMPNSYSYNCLLEAISKSSTPSSVDLLESRLKEMRNNAWQPDKFTFTPLLQVYCKAGKFENALDVYNEIFRHGLVDAHVVNILVLAFSKNGEVDKAFELIESTVEQNIRLNEMTFCILIRGFVRASRVDKALQTFHLMRKSGHVPDLSLYDALIDGFCLKKDIEKVQYLFADMMALGINPDVKILKTIIPSLPGEDEMLRILESMQKSLNRKSVMLLYNSILNDLVSNGSVDKAYDLLQLTMKSMDFKENKFLNSTSFCIVIDGFYQIGKMDLALNLFNVMVQKGLKQNVLLYNNLIDGLCVLNRLEESNELFQKMKESGFEPTEFTHNVIFGCLCRRVDVTGALDMVKLMRVHGKEPWIKHYSLLVVKLCKLGKAEEACKFLEDMVAEGFLPDIIAYAAAIDGFVKINELDRAVEIFRDICARSYCPDVVAYNVLINGFCKAERPVEAEGLLDEMLEKGLVPSVVTYNLLIDNWCKNGSIDKALLCLSRMFVVEREPTIITYSTIVNGLCNAGKPDDAIRLWAEMVSKGYLPNRIAFMALIHGLCKCGKPHAALGYLREMKEKELKPDVYIYVKLIQAFLCDVKPDTAFTILKEMVDEGSLPGQLDKNHLLLRDAILTLYRDSRTSSNVKDLLSKGGVPTISLSDIETEDRHETII